MHFEFPRNILICGRRVVEYVLCNYIILSCSLRTTNVYFWSTHTEELRSLKEKTTKTWCLDRFLSKADQLPSDQSTVASQLKTMITIFKKNYHILFNVFGNSTPMLPNYTKEEEKIMEKCVMYICIPCPSTCTYHYNIVCHYKLASFAVLGPGVFDLHKQM